MTKHESNYRSYLLRLWREDLQDSSWRAMLEEIGSTGERRYFKDLESLVRYLLDQGRNGQYKEADAHE